MYWAQDWVLGVLIVKTLYRCARGGSLSAPHSGSSVARQTFACHAACMQSAMSRILPCQDSCTHLCVNCRCSLVSLPAEDAVPALSSRECKPAI